jgi:hypothetical protein
MLTDGEVGETKKKGVVIRERKSNQALPFWLQIGHVNFPCKPV